MPLFWISSAFLCGVILAAQLNLPTKSWLWMSAVALGFCLLTYLYQFIRRKKFVHPTSARPREFLTHLYLPAWLLPWLPFFILLGGARYQAALPVMQPGFIAWYNDLKTSLVVEGELMAPPDERDHYTNLRVAVTRLHPDTGAGHLAVADYITAHGTLLAKVNPGGDWHYGDRVRLTGHLSTPPKAELFSYRDYLARQGVHALMSDATAARLPGSGGSPTLKIIYTLRQRALETAYRLFPDPEAALFAGILIGVEQGIPVGVMEAFRSTGTSHIIAISGFNMTILAALFAILFGKLLGRWRGALAAVLGIAFYTVLVGMNAAVVRAAILGILGILAVQIGRRQMALNSLAFAAALMALANPFVLWDVGFQLSFAATLGLVLYADALTLGFNRLAVRRLPASAVQRLSGPVSEYFLMTLAALVVALPVTIYYFRQLSLSSLVANPLILPAQPPLMILGGIALLAGMAYLPLGQLLAYLAWPFAAYSIRIVELLARIPGGSLALGQVALPTVLGFYLILFGLTYGMSQPAASAKAILKRLSPAIPLGIFALLTVLVWQINLSAPDGRLHLTLLEVSGEGRSGEAILIRTPVGRNLLIDGGPSLTRLSDDLGRRLPLGTRRLDWLVIAAPGGENLAALPELIQRYPPANILWAGPTHNTWGQRNLWTSLQQSGAPVARAQEGHSLDLGNGAVLSVLAAGEGGAVLLLEWGAFRALLPVGLDAPSLESERDSLTIGPVSVLLLAGNGTKELNPPEWLQTLQPQVVLLSVAADDRQGLPDPETLISLEGYNLLRTDRNGWIEITTDGEQMWVEVERK